MTYIRAVAAALASQNFRHLVGGSKGIARAIAARDEPNDDDHALLASIVREALAAERRMALEGRENDARHDALVARYAQLPERELRGRLAAVRSISLGPEIVDGHRYTARAVAAQGARDAYPERRALEEALAFKEQGQ